MTDNNGVRLIYEVMRFGVEEIHSDVFYHTSLIENDLKGYLNINKKINFLEKKYQEIYNNLTLDLYLMFLERGSNGIKDWYEYFKYIIFEDQPYFNDFLNSIKHLNFNSDDKNITQVSFAEASNVLFKLLNELKYSNKPLDSEDILRFHSDWVDIHESNQVLRMIKSNINILRKSDNTKKNSASLNSFQEIIPTDKYKALISYLKTEQIIDESNRVIKEKGYTEKRIIFAIIYNLKESKENWLVSPNIKDKELLHLAEKFFFCKLNQKTYSEAKNVFYTNPRDLHLDKVSRLFYPNRYK